MNRILWRWSSRWGRGDARATFQRSMRRSHLFYVSLFFNVLNAKNRGKLCRQFYVNPRLFTFTRMAIVLNLFVTTTAVLFCFLFSMKRPDSRHGLVQDSGWTSFCLFNNRIHKQNGHLFLFVNPVVLLLRMGTTVVASVLGFFFLVYKYSCC